MKTKITEEEKELAKRMEEEYERAKKDTVNNPRVVTQQPDKYNYLPGTDHEGNIIPVDKAKLPASIRDEAEMEPGDYDSSVPGSEEAAKKP
jgi:hypothetical protein